MTASEILTGAIRDTLGNLSSRKTAAENFSAAVFLSKKSQKNRLKMRLDFPIKIAIMSLDVDSLHKTGYIFKQILSIFSMNCKKENCYDVFTRTHWTLSR